MQVGIHIQYIQERSSHLDFISHVHDGLTARFPLTKIMLIP